MMMCRRFRTILAVLMALWSLLVVPTSAFSTNKMEARRRVQRQQQQLEAHPHYHFPSYFDADAFVKTVAGIMTAGLILFSSPLPSLADGSRVVGELRGSGLVFKVSDACVSCCRARVDEQHLYIFSHVYLQAKKR